MIIDWKKSQYADMSFLDKMSKKEREIWQQEEMENYYEWINFQNDHDSMIEEIDEYMLRHSLGKYMYKNKI